MCSSGAFVFCFLLAGLFLVFGVFCSALVCCFDFGVRIYLLLCLVSSVSCCCFEFAVIRY